MNEKTGVGRLDFKMQALDGPSGCLLDLKAWKHLNPADQDRRNQRDILYCPGTSLAHDRAGAGVTSSGLQADPLALGCSPLCTRLTLLIFSLGRATEAKVKVSVDSSSSSFSGTLN